MSDPISEGAVSRLFSSRTAIAELLVGAVLIAFGIHLVAAPVTSHLNPVESVIVGLAIIAAVLVSAAIWYLNRSTTHESYEALLLFDKTSGVPVEIREYEISRDVTSHLEAAFIENPALLTQWGEGPAPRSADQGNNMNKSIELLNEALEYYLLSSLSTHLNSYFSRANLDNSFIEVIERSNISASLLQNRFLDLFSRPVEDRPIFASEEFNKREHVVTIKRIDPDGTEEVEDVLAFGGPYYHRFHLTVPKDSVLSRTKENALQLSSSLINMTVYCRFDGHNAVVPYPFVTHYVGRDSPEDVDHLEIVVRIDTRIRWKGLISRKAWQYFMWSDSFASALRTATSSSGFMKRIDWDSVEANMIVTRRLLDRFKAGLSVNGPGNAQPGQSGAGTMREGAHEAERVEHPDLGDDAAGLEHP